MHGSRLLGILVGVLSCISFSNSRPCCTLPHQQIIYVNGTVICEDRSLILAYQFCEGFYAVDPNDTSEEVFQENSDKTMFTTDGQNWNDEYCTAVLNKSFDEGTYLVNMTGRVVALVCFGESELEEEDHYSIYATCLLISCVFLFATLIIYLILPELRDLQGKCVLCFILSLMIGYLCLIYLQMPFTSPEIANNECIIVAFLTYFWMMSAFFWLNINSFNMWRSSVLSHVSMSERKLMHSYYLVGWGMPLLFLGVALLTHHLPGNYIRPNFGVRSCWFKGKVEMWSYFYGPVLVLLVCNFMYFISMAVYLWSDYRNPNPQPRIKNLRTKFCLYFKLFLVMGITWIFEIISLIDNEPWFVTDILNCFQGVIIFVVMVALRRRVWRLLAARKPCGLQLTGCWERMNDDDETADEIVDEQQLATSNVNKD